MNTQKLFLVALAVGVVGCAKVWVKPGASTDDFNKDKFECMQQSQHQVSTVAVGKYSAFGQSGQETNIGLYSSCMNARGWALVDQQNDASTSAVKKNEIEQETNAIGDLGDSICADKRYAAIFAKSPCLVADLTIEQLSDKTKANAAQKAVMSPLVKDLKAYYRRSDQAYVKFNGSSGKKIAKYNEEIFFPKMDKNYLDLYEGKITWGEFNRVRKANHEDAIKVRNDYR